MAVLGNLGAVQMIYEGYQRLASGGQKIEQANIITRAIWTGEGFMKVLQGDSLQYGVGDWYWLPSRAIPAMGDVEPITEFPFFTVLYADLHAHLFALPLTLLALGVILGVLLGRARWKNLLAAGAWLVLAGLAIGVLRPTNTWDLPTYLALGAIVLAYTLWVYFEPSVVTMRGLSFLKAMPSESARLLTIAVAVALLVGCSFLFYQPYGQWYSQGYTSVKFWEGPHTPVTAYLIHWGLFLFIIVTWMFWETVQWMARTPLSAVRKLKPYQGMIYGALILLALCVAGLLYLQVDIGWLALPLAFWAGALILQPDLPDSKRFVLFLIGTGLVLTLAVELIVLVGDIGRMNTVFKFYLQVWTLFSVSAGAALIWLLPDVLKWQTGWQRAWSTALILLIAGGALFPILGGRAKVEDRMTENTPHTLDGLAYMPYSHYNEDWGDMDLSQDYQAIRWLQENVKGSPVIVEANLRNLYRWGSRITINTGLPGVVGWEWHQQQQRATLPGQWVTNRILEIDKFYQTTDLEEAHTFLRKYDVRYIIVGQQERGHYPGPGLDKFPAAAGVLWKQVYQDRATAIYEVVQ